MAYCRMGEDSDVYMYNSGVGWICCCGVDDVVLETREEALQHLLQHRDKGDRVPQSAVDRLIKEIASGRRHGPFDPQ